MRTKIVNICFISAFNVYVCFFVFLNSVSDSEFATEWSRIW